MQSVIIRLYAKVLFFVFAIICYLYGLFKKKRIIKWEKAPRETQGKIKRNEKELMVYYI